MQSAYEHLLEQIDRFTRKYYLNKVLKGSLLLAAALLSIYLLLSFGEFTFYFPSWLKLILVSGFALASIGGLFWWVIKPLLSYFKLGDQISPEEAAKIIGQHFSEVQDKLLNILQLKNEAGSGASRELIEASIQQKSKAIEWVPFSSAIDLKKNKQYLKYALPPIVAVVLLLIFSPDILKESNARLARPGETFLKPAPFEFVVINPSLKVVQFEDFVLKVKVKGKEIPATLEVFKGNEKWEMTATAPGEFSHRFMNVQEKFSFRLKGGGFFSGDFDLQVLKKPVVASMNIQLNYPSYTGKKPESIQNTGDFVVPEGTNVNWVLKGDNAEKIWLKWDMLPEQMLLPEDGKFVFSRRIMSDTRYKIIAGNADITQGDSVLFTINVTPDRAPSIAVEPLQDSLDKLYVYFMGNISDDYGFSRLEFHTRIYTEKNAIRSSLKQKIPLQKGALQDFSFEYDLAKIELSAGERMEYFFEIWDNDGVNGPKSARSAMFSFVKPSVAEYRAMESKTNNDIKQSLSSAAKEVKKMSSEIKNLRDKILTKKNLNWEDKKQAEDLLKQHEELSKQLEDTKEKLEENLKNQNEFKTVDEEMLQKQEQIQKMMDELLSQEMKDLMKELEELLEKFQDKNAFDKVENMQMSNENLNRELDKMMELFKRLELEQKANDIAQQLEDLAKKQEDLQKENSDAKQSNEDLAKKQEELNKEFNDLEKNIDELDKLNQDQKDPLDLSDVPEQKESIDQNMKDAKEQLQQQEKNKAGQKQQKASEQMKQMAQNIKNQMQEMQMAQSEEDINTIRRLLENLLKLSMDQENLMKDIRKTQIESPKYVALVQEQYKLKDDAVLIEDSLTALGKRVFQLQQYISDEMYKMKKDLKKSIDLLEDRQKDQAAVKQQYVMTTANNLALMLSEVMDQMQMQMNNAKPGSGQCSKPGGSGSKPSPSEMKKLQEQLGKDLKKTAEELKNGKGGSGMSKQLAEMAERQAAIRSALRKLKEQMSQQQKKDTGIDQVMDQMDKIESDIVNKHITAETLNRQKEIENKMLELETALREQDEDDTRKSNSAQEVPRQAPAELSEFLRRKKAAIDQYQAAPPELKPFYKKLVDKYFDTITP